MLGAAVGAGEERILAIERDRPDGALDDVGVDFDPAVIEEAGEARPSRESVADSLGELALLADEGELRLQPRFERIDDRAASRLSDITTLLGGSAGDLALDAIELGDARERLRRDRRGTALRQVIELPPDMAPAERQVHSIAIGQDLVAREAIDLQHADEASKVSDRLLGLAVGRVEIGDAWRIAAAPGSFVAGVGEELAGLGPAAAGIEHRCCGLVGEELCRRLQSLDQPLMHRS